MSLRSSIRNLLVAALIMVPMLTRPVAQAQIGISLYPHCSSRLAGL